MTMRFLESRTQRIFNNLIKQNQKMGSDSVLKQSTTVPSVQRPESSFQYPVSRVQSPASRVQRPASRVQGPASRVQRPGSSVQSPESRVQRPESNVQHWRPESRKSGMPFTFHWFLRWGLIIHLFFLLKLITVVITRLTVIHIAPLTVLFCNCPLLKEISFNTKYLLVWCD